MKNVLSIDLDSWVHVYADGYHLKEYQRRLFDGGDVFYAALELLDELKSKGHKATFFTTGEVAEWYPDLLQEIKKNGHEIGYHTHNHTLIKNKKVLVNELNKSKKFLEEFNPIGFRAPQCFFKEDCASVLHDYGFKYSSSSYHDFGLFNVNKLVEIPVSSFAFRKTEFKLPKKLSFKMLTKEFPFGSGVFISIFGRLTFPFINNFNKHGKPAVVFFHPWQYAIPPVFESNNIRKDLLLKIPLSVLYAKSSRGTIKKMLSKYEFTSFKEAFF